MCIRDSAHTDSYSLSLLHILPALNRWVISVFPTIVMWGHEPIVVLEKFVWPRWILQLMRVIFFPLLLVYGQTGDSDSEWNAREYVCMTQNCWSTVRNEVGSPLLTTGAIFFQNDLIYCQNYGVNSVFGELKLVSLPLDALRHNYLLYCLSYQFQTQSWFVLLRMICYI